MRVHAAECSPPRIHVAWSISPVGIVVPEEHTHVQFDVAERLRTHAPARRAENVEMPFRCATKERERLFFLGQLARDDLVSTRRFRKAPRRLPMARSS
jgi:hypothetical protein